MFDIGGPELIVVAIIAIIIIGPKELPGAIRAVTAVIRKARGLAAEFRSGLDEMVRETELDQVKQTIEEGLDPEEWKNSIGGDLKDTLDPDGDFEDAFDFDDDWYGPDEEPEEASAEQDDEEASDLIDHDLKTREEDAEPDESKGVSDKIDGDKKSPQRTADTAS